MFKKIFTFFEGKGLSNTVVNDSSETNHTIVTQASADNSTTMHTPSYSKINWNYLSDYKKPIEAKFSWRSTAESIDTFVLLLGKDNKIIKDSDLVFYNSEIRKDADVLKPFDEESFRNKGYWRDVTYPCSQNGEVWIESDYSMIDLDCEIVHVNLQDIENDINSIVFAHVVYSSPCNPKVLFGKDMNFEINIYEKEGHSLVSARCENLDNKNILLSCRLKRKQDGWNFEFLNESINGPVQNLIDMYID